MKALLDTHAFLWWIVDDPQLSARARKRIGSGDNAIHLSAASAWELAIKARLGRLTVHEPLEAFVARQLSLNGFAALPVQVSHALRVQRLPDHHRDPFDRLLVAQAQLEDMPLITADRQIRRYEVDVIW